MMFILAHDTARARAVRAIDEAPHGWVVRITEPTRNLEQNAAVHAVFTDFERSGIEWAGRKRTAAEWKIILVSGYSYSEKMPVEMMQGIEGEPVILREKTSRMTVKRMSGLIEYCRAVGSEMGVKWSEPE